jgi:hypothetical protein
LQRLVFVVVDKPLSRGLADRALAQIQELAHRYSDGIRRSLQTAEAYPKRREMVRRIATSLIDCGERASMMQILGRHPKWRWASLAAFLPDVKAPGNGRSDRSLNFGLFRFLVQVDRPFSFQGEFPVALAIQEHAIQRLFQRLNVITPATVRDEMHDALCLSLPLQAVACRLGLKQIVLPTRLGAFLCSFEPGVPLTARTWIERPERASRHGSVITAIENCYEPCAAEIEVAQELAALPIETDLVDFPASHSLLERLHGMSWLKEEYVPRADPVGDIWRQARAASA